MSVVTERLAQALRGSDLTGWRLAPVKVTTSDEYEELYPDVRLPPFHWLQVGRDPSADLAISAKHRLVASGRALELLRRFQLDNATIEPVA
ncbi:MAG TPA: hypothetical protein VFT22_10665 [Kofleriaceae bacterium]|nr:hypothetical protein [Kofleriaceae bacterium]